MQVTGLNAETLKRHEVRQLCRAYPHGLYYFGKAVCGFDKLWAPLHLKFANYIQLHPWNGGPPRSNRKLAWAPREHFKSTICSVIFPLWLLSCVDWNYTIALISADADNTKKWLRAIKEIIKYNGFFRWAFPEIRPGDKWDEEEIIIRRDRHYGSDVQASVTAYSINSGLASQHHRYIVLDDPVNEQVAGSVAMMADAVRLYIHLEEILRGWFHSGYLIVDTPWGREDPHHAALREVAAGYRLKWGIGVLGDFEISPELADRKEMIPTLPLGKPIFPQECNEDKLNLIKSQDIEKFYMHYLPLGTDEKVLMADFSSRAISDVSPGDTVIGFTPYHHSSRLVPTKVVAVHDMFGPRIRLHLDSGHSVVCSPDHRWFRSWARPYSPAELKSPLRAVRPLAGGEELDWEWLRGFIDGEGTVNGANILVAQSPGANPDVVLEIDKRLERLDLEYKIYESPPSNERHGGLRNYHIKGGRRLKLKLLERPFGKAERLKSVLFAQRWDWTAVERVVSIEALPPGPLRCLETETGNFIGGGLASGNCKPYDTGRNGFHLELIRDFALFPDGKIQCGCPGHETHYHHLAQGSTVAVSDPAYTTDKKNCESSILIIHEQPCGCRFLLDEWGGHVSLADYYAQACSMAFMWKTWLGGFGVEAEHVQSAMGQVFRELKAQGRFPVGVEILELKPKRRAKDLRIGGQITPVNNGLWHKRPTNQLVEGQNNTLLQVYQWPYSRKRDRADAFGYAEDAFEMRPPRRLDPSGGKDRGVGINIKRQEDDLAAYTREELYA